jgi:hypothetical protein
MSRLAAATGTSASLFVATFLSSVGFTQRQLWLRVAAMGGAVAFLTGFSAEV